MNDPDYLIDYFKDKKSYFQHYFYAEQRKKFNILVNNGKPVNGKWSFDSENRKSIPKDLNIPKLLSLRANKKFIDEAKKYVNSNFKDNPGSNENFYFPISPASSKKWLEDFLKNKFDNYGSYQDAIVKNESFLFHSFLSPLINSGLLKPDYVIDKALEYADSNEWKRNDSFFTIASW
jgi:deoxyribodipyrimidine photolyase-related protein